MTGSIRRVWPAAPNRFPRDQSDRLCYRQTPAVADSVTDGPGPDTLHSPADQAPDRPRKLSSGPQPELCEFQTPGLCQSRRTDTETQALTEYGSLRVWEYQSHRVRLPGHPQTLLVRHKQSNRPPGSGSLSLRGHATLLLTECRNSSSRTLQLRDLQSL